MTFFQWEIRNLKVKDKKSKKGRAVLFNTKNGFFGKKGMSFLKEKNKKVRKESI